MKSEMKKICIVVASRANFSRIKQVAIILRDTPGVELQLVVGGSALLYQYGNVAADIEKEFNICAKASFIVSGDSPSDMAKSTGLAIIELTTIFEQLSPDIVLTIADRYETLATAVAASYMNIPLAHTQGGEITGSIDESVRHAITKMAHIHFPCTELSESRLIKMGEDPKTIVLSGCPSIDLAKQALESFDPSFNILTKYGGSGISLDWDQDFIVVLQHPVTTQYTSVDQSIQETISAIKDLNMQTIWLWPNVDAGSDLISKRLRELKTLNQNRIRFFRNFKPIDFLHILLKSRCIVGNSSVGIRECSYLGVPCVNIGNRQSLRERSVNVVDVKAVSIDIKRAVQNQINRQHYPSTCLYGDGSSSLRIADTLVNCNPTIQKYFHD